MGFGSIVAPWFIPTITAAIWSVQFHNMFYRLEGDLLELWRGYIYYLKLNNRGTSFWLPTMVRGNDSYSETTRNHMFFQTFLVILLTVLSMVQLFWVLYTSPKKSFAPMTISAPKHYTKGMDIKSWLTSTDLYHNALGVTDDHSKCISVLSRLDPGCTKLLSGLGVDVNAGSVEYSKLAGHLIHLFGDNSTDSSNAMRAFGSRSQKLEENVSLYFSELNELARLAFSTLTVEDLDKVVAKQFAEGVRNSTLRIELLRALEKTKEASWLTPEIKVDVLALARDFDKFSKSGAVINLSRPECPCVAIKKNGLTTVVCTLCCTPYSRKINKNSVKSCHLCKVSGHVYSQCPNKEIPVASVLHAAARATDSIKTIMGSCSVEGTECEFLVDTGASQSIVRENIIAQEYRYKIKPVDYRVFTMDGSVAAIKGTYDAHVLIGDALMVVKLLVTSELVYDFLLGMDVLTMCPLTRPIIVDLQEAVRSKCVDPLLFEPIAGLNKECDALPGDIHLLQSIPEEEDDYDYNINPSKLPENVYHDLLSVIDSPLEVEASEE